MTNATSIVVNAFTPSSAGSRPGTWRKIRRRADDEDGGGESSVVNDQLTSVTSALPARSSVAVPRP